MFSHPPVSLGELVPGPTPDAKVCRCSNPIAGHPHAQTQKLWTQRLTVFIGENKVYISGVLMLLKSQMYSKSKE